ncbi:hypothetical protein ABTM69_20660, partial [Acinetobacter baumannii]
MLTDLLQVKKHEAWLERFHEFKREEVKVCIDKELYPTTEELTMGEVIHVLNELTNGDAIIVTDVGQHQMVACRYAKFNQ